MDEKEILFEVEAFADAEIAARYDQFAHLAFTVGMLTTNTPRQAVLWVLAWSKQPLQAGEVRSLLPRLRPGIAVDEFGVERIIQRFKDVCIVTYVSGTDAAKDAKEGWILEDTEPHVH